MATDLEQLQVTLSAKADQFKQEMQSAVREFDRDASQIEQRNQQLSQSMNTNMQSAAVSTKFLAGALKSLFSAYAVEEFISSIKRATDAIANLKRQSDDARLATQNVVGLRLAGIQQGASTGEIDKALENFSKSSQKTKEDAVGIYRAFDQIGPAFGRAFATAPTQTERMNVFSRALNAAGSAAKEMQLAQNVLGTTNERVINTFKDFNGNIDTLGVRARAAGINLDEGLAAKADEAARKLDLMAEVTSTKMKIALSDLVPFLITTIQEFDALVKSIEGGAAAVGHLFEQGAKLLGLDKGGDHAAVGGVYDPDQQRTIYPGQPGYDALSKQTGSGIYTDRLPLRRPTGTGGSGGKPALPQLANLGKKGSEGLDEYDQEYNRIEKQIVALTGQKEALGLVGEAAVKAEAAERLKEAADEAGLPKTAALNMEIDAQAEKLAKLKVAYAAGKLEQDLFFERSQIGRTPDEQAIASRIRGAGLDPASKDAQDLADKMRTIQNLTEGKEMAGSFVKGLISDLENGVKAGQALENQLKRIAEKLADKAIDSLISSLFGAATGSGGFLSTVFHSQGGFAGSGPRSLVPASAFIGAQQFAAGGGIPAILHAGEIVLNQAQQKNVAQGLGSIGPINLTHAPVINGTGLSADQVFSVVQRSQKDFARQIGPIFSDWQRRQGRGLA